MPAFIATISFSSHGFKRVLLLAVAAVACVNFTAWTRGAAQGDKVGARRVRLGERLFRDERFSTPKGDLPAACASCHILDEDPQGLRAYNDNLNRSWMSYRPQDPRRLMLRNSPTLFDTALMPRLHYDGEFGSLEELVKGTFTGRPMGWLPGEQAEATMHLHAVLAGDAGYREQFRQVYGVEVDKPSLAVVLDYVAQSVAAFLRTLNSRRDAPYDRFIRANGLDAAPASGEDARTFARRLATRLAELETKGALKTAGFGKEALRGLKIFLRDEGTTSVGNCAACHAPPHFTDFSFHNVGISQADYDQFHGAGAFVALDIPTAERPSARFRENPARDKPGAADLGCWNFIDLKNSPLRRAGESDERLLQRMIGAFKTPTLRHLAYSQPYLHNGSYATVEDVLRELLRLSELARAGKVREADAELAKIKLTEADIAPLAAFLATLNEDVRLSVYSSK